MNWYMLCKKLGERGSAALPQLFYVILSHGSCKRYSGFYTGDCKTQH